MASFLTWFLRLEGLEDKIPIGENEFCSVAERERERVGKQEVGKLMCQRMGGRK